MGTSASVVSILHIINILGALLLPAVAIVIVHPAPVFSVLVVFHSMLVCLKLYSWKDLNQVCRTNWHASLAAVSPPCYTALPLVPKAR